MKTRRIGSLNVSEVGLGCNNFGWYLDAKGTTSVVDAALNAGINFFDTADMYGQGESEVFLGRALGSRRKDVLVATKFGLMAGGKLAGAKPEYIAAAVEASLKRLGTDYIDLYQIHKPDPETPIEDTLGKLNELVQAGKVREIGCSNFSVDQIRAARAGTRAGAAQLVSIQNHYSLIHRDPEHGVIPECRRLGLAFLPYFPLANGLLTGKYRKGQAVPAGTRIQPGTYFADWLTEENLERVESLHNFATSRGHSLLELAVSWLLAEPAVSSVIAGATKAGQVEANARAATWRLDRGELEAKLNA